MFSNLKHLIRSGILMERGGDVSSDVSSPHPAIRTQSPTGYHLVATAARCPKLFKFPGSSEVPTQPLVRFAEIIFITCALLISCAGCQQKHGPAMPPPPEVTFKPQEMADALHAVIAADREVYSRHILQRLQADEKLIKVSENWQQDKALPLPAQILRMGSEAVQQKGAEFHYVLRSLWPINPKNAPETATEKTGLQAVLNQPETNYYSQESLGGRRYFTAVYPDRATVPSCVECHNGNSASSKRDFKLGDVMGGMVVRVPLEF